MKTTKFNRKMLQKKPNTKYIQPTTQVQRKNAAKIKDTIPQQTNR